MCAGLRDAGHTVHNELFFDTLKVTPASGAAAAVRARAEAKRINLRYFADGDVSPRFSVFFSFQLFTRSDSVKNRQKNQSTSSDAHSNNEKNLNNTCLLQNYTTTAILLQLHYYSYITITILQLYYYKVN